MEITTNTTNHRPGDPVAFKGASGLVYVGLWSGDVDDVGTDDESVIIDDVVRFSDEGVPSEWLNMGVLTSGILTVDEARPHTLAYLRLKQAEACDALMVAESALHRASAELDRWSRLLDEN